MLYYSIGGLLPGEDSGGEGVRREAARSGGLRGAGPPVIYVYLSTYT